jgi:hypothetical protein
MYFEPSLLLLYFKNKIEPPVRVRLRKTLRLDKMLTRQAQTVSGRVPGIALSDDRTWPYTGTIRCANERGFWVGVA